MTEAVLCETCGKELLKNGYGWMHREPGIDLYSHEAKTPHIKMPPKHPSGDIQKLFDRLVG